MATFIFGEKELEHPIFVSFNPGYKNFQIAQATETIKPGREYKIQILYELPKAYNEVKNGITITTPDKNQVKVSIKRQFIFEKLQVFYNGKEIKGHEFIY